MGEMTQGQFEQSSGRQVGIQNFPAESMVSPSHIFSDVVRRTFWRSEAAIPLPGTFAHSSVLCMIEVSGRRRPVEAAARAAGVSEFHFIRRFKRETRMTPGEFLLRYRIVRAMDLLTGTAASIAAVGKTVGYRDASTFSRAFLKVAGISPLAYRQGQRAPVARVAEAPQSYEPPDASVPE